MNSDDLFWHLVLVRRNVDEAALLWWLMRSQAETRRRRIEPAVITRHFGFGRKRLQRAREALLADGLVKCFIVKDRSVEYELLGPVVLYSLRTFAFQSVTVDSADRRDVMKRYGVAVRLALHLQSRPQAILLSWLLAVGGGDFAPVLVPTRRLEQELGSLVDHVTAWRALARLQAADLVTVGSRGRAGTEYQLNRPTLDALLQAPCPWGPDAGTQIPGWSLHEFPMLAQIARTLDDAAEEIRQANLRRSSESSVSTETVKEVEC